MNIHNESLSLLFMQFVLAYNTRFIYQAVIILYLYSLMILFNYPIPQIVYFFYSSLIFQVNWLYSAFMFEMIFSSDQSLTLC